MNFYRSIRDFLKTANHNEYGPVKKFNYNVYNSAGTHQAGYIEVELYYLSDILLDDLYREII